MKFNGTLASLVMINLLLSPVGRAENAVEKHAGVPSSLGETHLHELKKLAFAGNAKAQFSLGLIYEEGRGGIKKDLAYALSWYEEAAHNGLKAAANKLKAYK